jgi:hypothetical protein
MGLYKVTTLVQFKHVYFVEGKCLEHALDEVSMRESGNDDDYFEESGQQYLGEVIVDGEEVTMRDFEKFLTKAENGEVSSSHWMGDKLIHKMRYEEDEQTPDTITVSVYDESYVNDTNMNTPSPGHEAFKQMGTSLILGKPSIGLPGDLEKVRYGRWNPHLRGY